MGLDDNDDDDYNDDSDRIVGNTRYRARRLLLV